MINNFKRVGFMPAWKINKLAKIRYDVLSDVIYSFAFPDEGLDLVIPNLEKAHDIVGMAHKEKVNVMLSVGGWDDFGKSHSANMLRALNCEETMDILIENIIAACYDLSFDGIDINWGNLGDDVSRQEDIETFMSRLSAKLKSLNMPLSISCFGNYNSDNKVVSYELASCSEKVLEVVDFVNIITYENRKGVRATNTNLKMEKELTKEIIIPNEKTVMGIPFFVNLSMMAYEEDIKNAKGNGEIDSEMITCGREVYCIDDDQFKQKVKWAKEHAIGLNVWEVTQDFAEQEKSLLTKINDELK